MSAGVYALIGVIVGGLLSVGGQAALTWWQSKKTREADWIVANRLITDELERMMRDLTDLIDDGVVPLRRRDDMLGTSVWEEHRAAVARWLPNDPNDPKTDEFWRGLSRIYANARELRWMLGVWTPGSELSAKQHDDMRIDRAYAASAYEAMTGVLPEVSRRPGFESTGAQTGAQELDSA